MKLNERLCQLRKQKGLTQADVAERLGISRQAVSRWEIGAAVPTVENFKELSELFDVSLDYLMPGDSDSADASPQLISERIRKGEPSTEDTASSAQSSQEAHLRDKDPAVEETNVMKQATGRVKIYVVVVVVVVCLAILAVAWIYSQQALFEQKDEEDAWLSQLDVDHSESQVGENFQFE